MEAWSTKSYCFPGSCPSSTCRSPAVPLTSSTKCVVLDVSWDNWHLTCHSVSGVEMCHGSLDCQAFPNFVPKFSFSILLLQSPAVPLPPLGGRTLGQSLSIRPCLALPGAFPLHLDLAPRCRAHIPNTHPRRKTRQNLPKSAEKTNKRPKSNITQECTSEGRQNRCPSQKCHWATKNLNFSAQKKRRLRRRRFFV